MPDQETIRQKVNEIASSDEGDIPSEGEVWEGTDGGARFRVTRHPLSLIALDIIKLKIAGESQERARVIGEFGKVLDPPPDLRGVVTDDPDHVDVAQWAVNAVYNNRHI